MSHYLKSTLAHLPQTLPTLQRCRPNLQLPNPTPYYEKSRKLHTRHPRAFIALAILLFLLFWKDIIRDSYSHLISRKAASILGENPILNSTLGFQDIFVLSLPDRADRREPFLAAADATNLSITVIDAIRDREIPESDWPKWWGTSGWVPKEGELGCLMSHVRTWRKIIHGNITSALIMESDVDWDMRIKQSMVGVGEGTKTIADWPFDPSPTSQPVDAQKSSEESENPQPRPYGDKWDLLWVGHCGSSANGDGRIYAFNDSAAPDEEHAWAYAGRPAEGHRPPGTRIVYQLDKAVCTTSYAISNQGAHKFEKIFQEANSPIDLKLWDACANNPQLACLAVWPQVISMAESRGNIKHTEGGLSFGHEITEEKIVAGKSIQVSSRVNAHLGTADKGPAGWTWEWRDGDDAEKQTQEDSEVAEVAESTQSTEGEQESKEQQEEDEQ